MELLGLNNVLANLGRIEERYRDGAVRAAVEIGAVLEAYAKEHHLWQRDTGETDASTRGRIEDIRDNLVSVILTVGTEWSIFLEKAFGGRYAWVRPAAVANANEIEVILRRHLSR